MTLTVSQVDQVREALNRAGMKGECPACATGKLKVGKNVVTLPEWHESAHGRKAVTTGMGLNCAFMLCEGCGYVRLHHLATLGLDHMVG